MDWSDWSHFVPNLHIIHMLIQSQNGTAPTMILVWCITTVSKVTCEWKPYIAIQWTYWLLVTWTAPEAKGTSTPSVNGSVKIHAMQVYGDAWKSDPPIPKRQGSVTIDLHCLNLDAASDIQCVYLLRLDNLCSPFRFYLTIDSQVDIRGFHKRIKMAKLASMRTIYSQLSAIFVFISTMYCK